jgi:acetoin utilization protein AcuB
MRVERWMTTPVVTVSPDCPALAAYRKMLEHQFRRLPVVNDDGGLIGVVTDRDLRGILLPSGLPDARGEYREFAHDVTVSEVMSTDPLTVEPHTDVRQAALLMHNHKISGLPVVDGGRCVGIITAEDLMEILVSVLDEREVAKADDHSQKKVSA